MKDWSTLKKELLQNKEVAKEYQNLAPRYKIVSQLITARIEKGLTQKDLAEKIGTQQSAIARLEAGNINPSLALLEKVAGIMGYKIDIQLKH